MHDLYLVFEHDLYQIFEQDPNLNQCVITLLQI